MHLEKITLAHFKNYTAENLAFSPQVNAFIGLNGMGKTNLLDAIYFLCVGKSHFLISDADVIQHAADFTRLEGIFQREKREKIVVKIPKKPKKKIVERNDVAYSTLAEHVGLLPVVMFTPDDTDLVKDGSESRRRFLDHTLSQMDSRYLAHLMQYNKILHQRNALLKQNLQHSVAELWSLLEVYDAQLRAPATYIFEQRKTFSALFNPLFNDFYRRISDAHEAVACTYTSPLFDASLPDLLTQNQQKDTILGRTSTGIHRDDLSFEMDGQPLKKFGSQGQLKSFVISLRLAQYQLLKAQMQNNPILLLDDLFDKLDTERVANLLDLLLTEQFGQIFLSDTHPERIETLSKQFVHIEFRRFWVQDGNISK
jgi:DNA replication and repair protein RecF